MATIVVKPLSRPVVAAGCQLATAIITNTDSDVADRRELIGPADLVVTYTDLGASQTVTLDIQGSCDLANWWNVPYALVATPSTFTVAQIVFSTASGGVVHYLLQGGQPWRYLRLTTSAITNMQVDATVFCFAP